MLIYLEAFTFCGTLICIVIHNSESRATILSIAPGSTCEHYSSSYMKSCTYGGLSLQGLGGGSVIVLV